MVVRGGARQVRTVRREPEARVTPLELFFDLVFVLAITQCTALMAGEPTWRGMAKGLLVLAVIWWSWVGYSWLTSVIDPEEGPVRLSFFGAMGALLVMALAIPEAFDEQGLTFALAFLVLRTGHIVLFMLAGRGDPDLTRSVLGLAASSAMGVALLVGASFLDGAAQGALWALAIGLDVAGPYVFGSEGWKLSPGHFAERHGLILIIALGESIVVIGAGAGIELTGGELVGAVVAVAVAAAFWWLYFDVLALGGERRLAGAPVGKEQNELARDAYSFIHFPMVAGIVLVALGFKKALGHVDEPLSTVGAFALTGGAALYLVGLVLFRWRLLPRPIHRERLGVALLLLATWPLATRVDALWSVGAVAAVVWALAAFETVAWAETRDRMRHAIGAEAGSTHSDADADADADGPS